MPSPENPQSLNRYSYVLNSPLRYTDPTGHFTDDELASLLGDNWQELMQLWQEYDPYWYYILRNVLEGGYTMTASEAYLPGLYTGRPGGTGTERWYITFSGSGKDIQAFEYVMNEKTGYIGPQSPAKLVNWQGQGAYMIYGPGDVGDIGSAALFKKFIEYNPIATGVVQPEFDYGSDPPTLKRYNLIQPRFGRFEYKGWGGEFVKSLDGKPGWSEGAEFLVDLALLIPPFTELGVAKFAADTFTSIIAMTHDTTAYRTIEYPFPR